MAKKNLKSEIFNIVLNNGVTTSKADILGEDPMEDKVYTKKINIGKDYEFKNNVDVVEVVSVSLTCENKDMSDASPRKVRFNLKNRANSWVNIFMHEAPKELVEFVYEHIH